MPPFRARAPLDLDLEDRLIFGLTPLRFAYVAVGCLFAYGVGAHGPGGTVFRLPLGVLVLGLAAAVAWVRWRGRPLDAWVLDIAVYARRNLEVEIDPVVLRRIRAPLQRPARPRFSVLRAGVPSIAVAAAEPGAGATTVAVELGAALALKGRRVALAQPGRATAESLRLTLDETGRHAATGLRVAAGGELAGAECVVLDLGTQRPRARADLGLLVVTGAHDAPGLRAVPARHVEILVNRAGEPGLDTAGLRVPDDPNVPLAQAAGEPVIVQFPRSRAALAFRRLADSVDPSRPGPWQESSGVPPPG